MPMLASWVFWLRPNPTLIPPASCGLRSKHRQREHVAAVQWQFVDTAIFDDLAQPTGVGLDQWSLANHIDLLLRGTHCSESRRGHGHRPAIRSRNAQRAGTLPIGRHLISADWQQRKYIISALVCSGFKLRVGMDVARGDGGVWNRGAARINARPDNSRLRRLCIGDGTRRY